MRPVNINIINQYVEECGCSLVGVPRSLTFHTAINVKCNCGSEFEITPKQIHGYKHRKSILNCGCIDKKWTNDNIDRTIAGRYIERLTNCNITGFQPSASHVGWKCKKCNHEWWSRVDSVINKKSGCPRCAGNIAYSAETLNAKLLEQGRTDLAAIEIHGGSLKGKTIIRPTATFECRECGNKWVANFHNVIKFRYGCPPCNDNIGTRVDINGMKFHSKLEYYFWKQYEESNKPYVLLRQQKYLPSRRLTCDYYIPEKRLWVEITGGVLLNSKRYRDTIEEKRTIILQKNENFITLVTFADINNFINEL